jgi:hypothetical protein
MTSRSGFALPNARGVVRWRESDEFRSWAANNAPRMPWDKFTRTVFHPTPGQHAAIIGATGQGKTYLLRNIMPFWPYVAAFGTKNHDSTMQAIVDEDGYERYERWVPMSAYDHPRRVIWPNIPKLREQKARQKVVFENAIDAIWAEGGRPKNDPIGWAIAIDELWWFSNMLQMREDMQVLLLQGRSNGISLLAATQRPFEVPVELYSMSTHLFFFQDDDENNLRRIGEIKSSNKGNIRLLVSSLDEHQVLYVNTRTGKMARTRAPKPKG